MNRKDSSLRACGKYQREREPKRESGREGEKKERERERESSGVAKLK